MNEHDLLDVIRQRRSERGPFDEDRPIEPAVLHDILEAATWAPTAHNMQNFEIVVVDDKEVLAKISELKQATSPVFVQENYRQLSFSEEELRQKKTGILADRFPAVWLTPEAQAGKLESAAAPLGEQIRRGPVLMLILYDPSRRAPASEGDFLGIMSLGFMLENIWLMATASGLGMHIVSPLGNEPVASEIKQMLNIAPQLKLTLSCRLGYPLHEDTSLRVRRDLEDFVSYNRYQK